MKRILGLLLAVVMLVLSVSVALGPLVVSADSTDIDTETSFPFDSVDFSCHFDEETSKIHVDGVIRHDVFVTHNDYTIQIYAIPPGADAKTVINDPTNMSVAGSNIAIKFEFVLDAKDVLLRYSRYCVVLRSPEGEQILCSEPKFAEVATAFVANSGDRSAYKGIATSEVSVASHAGAGRVIIPVYFDRLISATSNGYVYGMDGENLYFDKSYVQEMDIKIRSATAVGTQVYLQYFLFSEYVNVLPDTYDTEILRKIEAITTFLCERYENFQSGVFSGIVVGKAIDRSIPMYADEAAVTEYAEKYARYVIAVANTARRIHPSMDIVLPFSSANTYAEETVADVRSPSFFLECVLSILDRGFTNRFSCTAMIESDTVPLSYPDGWESGKAPLSSVEDDTALHAGNIEKYAQYLNRLRTRFESTPEGFMFVWQVPNSLNGNALCAAYAYSYFRLISESQLTSFVVSFVDSERVGHTTGFSDISHLYTYIDTAESASVTKNLLSYFAIDSWGAISSSSYEGSYTLRTLYRTVPTASLPSDIKGSFAYFDFSTSVNLNTWFAGNACRGIRLNYLGSGTKALQMDMTATDGAYAEAFCLYEYPENFVYTPYVAFRVAVEEKEENASSALYEISITSGTGRTSIVASTSLHAGEMETIVLDLSDYVKDHMSNYWRISVRPLDGDHHEYSLWISDIVGYSTEYSQTALEELIHAERLRIRNLDNTADDDNGSRETFWMIVGIVGVVAMIGIGVFILLRMNDEGGHEENKEKDNE